MIAVDTSVVVAGFATWHEHHDLAREVLDDGPALPSQAALESYSVLTRLPGGLRAAPTIVVEFLSDRFPSPPLTLAPPIVKKLPSKLADLGVEGGAVWDAVIALTAAAHDMTLATLDARAADTYRRCSVETRFLR